MQKEVGHEKQPTLPTHGIALGCGPSALTTHSQYAYGFARCLASKTGFEGKTVVHKLWEVNVENHTKMYVPLTRAHWGAGLAV